MTRDGTDAVQPVYRNHRERPIDKLSVCHPGGEASLEIRLILADLQEHPGKPVFNHMLS